LAFYGSSVVASPELSPYYPPVLKKQTNTGMHSDNNAASPPKLCKETTALLSSPDSSPCLPPPLKKAKPLSFSDDSLSSSQTNVASTAKSDAVNPKVIEERIRFLSEAFPGIPKQVTEQFDLC